MKPEKGIVDLADEVAAEEGLSSSSRRRKNGDHRVSAPRPVKKAKDSREEKIAGN